MRRQAMGLAAVFFFLNFPSKNLLAPAFHVIFASRSITNRITYQSSNL